MPSTSHRLPPQLRKMLKITTHTVLHSKVNQRRPVCNIVQLGIQNKAGPKEGDRTTLLNRRGSALKLQVTSWERIFRNGLASALSFYFLIVSAQWPSHLQPCLLPAIILDRLDVTSHSKICISHKKLAKQMYFSKVSYLSAMMLDQLVSSTTNGTLKTLSYRRLNSPIPLCPHSGPELGTQS